MPHDAGNEISSYSERTRGIGLSTTWHYTYLSLLTGFGIVLFFPFPLQVWTLTILAAQEAHPSVQHLPRSPLPPQKPGTFPLPTHPAPRIPGDQEATLLTPLALYLPRKSPQWHHLPNPSQITARGWNLAFGREVQSPSSCSCPWGKSRLLDRICFHPWFWSTVGWTTLATNTAGSRMC